MPETIEIFQDLRIDIEEEERDRFLDALEEVASRSDRWAWDKARSTELALSVYDGRSVRFFKLAEGGDLPSAGLGLWESETGFYVPNIVPIGRSELSRTQYNAVLGDFVKRIVAPVADDHRASIVTTSAQQGLRDWMNVATAECLVRFSRAANKSTGASHPSDRKRWNMFLVSAHRHGDELSAERLARWLNEIEGWDMEGAYDLAAEFETALELLEFYDGR